MTDDLTRTQSVSDVMDPARAHALHTALGLPGSPPDILPPFFHHLYFWDVQPSDALGRDGHPKVGGVIPDMGLPRRMWAGGRLEFLSPLQVGQPAQKHSRVEKASHKVGRTGPLGFVTLRHEVTQDGEVKLREYQDLVYREDPNPTAPKHLPPEAGKDEDSCEAHGFTSTLLFRYSALTFNGHRIHYDLDYCRDFEGYAGLVVHGPLLAQLLMLKAARELGPLKTFGFRATAPLVHRETAELCRKGTDLWVRGPDGRQCMEATAEV
ncbi:MaoC family dehydratase N-terminal domain-containing protein [Aliiroseovarius sp.]|uniref:FAS1-like dehydratase domain-containing protein n=1 Tax=Aliiroseovarius sp. TaxID=1872442 RepID=UPI00261F121B|nr:MaoC family dehydratase N-terminal domain-containing protein [Aliiroseovarius sp.]